MLWGVKGIASPGSVSPNPPRKPVLVRIAGIEARIYFNPQQVRGELYDSFLVKTPDPLRGRQAFNRFSTLKAAKAFAEEKCRLIANGQASVAVLTNEDAAHLGEARELRIWRSGESRQRRVTQPLPNHGSTESQPKSNRGSTAVPTKRQPPPNAVANRKPTRSLAPLERLARERRAPACRHNLPPPTHCGSIPCFLWW